MSRRYHLTHTRALVAALILPILVIGGGYALFSQNLSIQGTATAEVSSAQTPSLQISWTIQKWQSGNTWSYNVTAQVKNIGTIAVTGWEAKVTLPVSLSALHCWNGDCSLTATTLTIQNMSYNGSIAPNATADFGMSFTTDSGSLSFSNYTVTGDSGQTSDSDFVAIPGLTATMSYQNGWQSGGEYIKQYDVEVSNNSGSRVKAWRIEISNWNSMTESVVNIWNANYTSEPTRLLLMSTGMLDNTTNASFGGQLKVQTNSWSPTYVVKGKL